MTGTRFAPRALQWFSLNDFGPLDKPPETRRPEVVSSVEVRAAAKTAHVRRRRSAAKAAEVAAAKTAHVAAAEAAHVAEVSAGEPTAVVEAMAVGEAMPVEAMPMEAMAIVAGTVPIAEAAVIGSVIAAPKRPVVIIPAVGGATVVRVIATVRIAGSGAPTAAMPPITPAAAAPGL